MDSFNDVLDAAKEYCRLHTADAAYEYYISGLKAVSFENSNCVTLSVRNDFIRQIVSDRYTALLKEAFKSVLGFDIEVQFVVPQPEPEKAPAPSAEDSLPSGRYDFTFENFIKGPSNQFAYAAAQAVAANPSGAYNPLFIYGPSGLGKTHLLNAIANEFKKNYPDRSVVYAKSEAFTNEIIEAIARGTTPAFREKYRKADLFLMDDIQFIAGKISVQEEFFHTFNTLYEAKKQIVLTSDRPPKDISTLDDRLKTRFEWGLTADVQPPEFETRIAIIIRKAESVGLDIPETVCEYIANRLKNNIRQLEGAVKKLRAFHLLENKPINIATAQAAISDIINNNQPAPVTVDKIIEEVARTFSGNVPGGITPEDIRSKKRNANISMARQVSIYIAREITNMSMVEIGQTFGGRDHSTVVYAIRQAEQNIKKDPRTKALVDDIIKNIRDR